MKFILTIVSAAFLILQGCGQNSMEDPDAYPSVGGEFEESDPPPPPPPSFYTDTFPADEEPEFEVLLPPPPSSYPESIPEKMKVGVSSKVEVRLIRKVGEEAVLSITKDTPSGAESIVDTIRTSAVMSVRLEGINFEIVELSDERQIVISIENTRWEWLVTPLSSGTHALKITAIAHLIAPPDLDEVWDLPIYSQQVKVAVNFPYSLSKIWNEHWEWIIATLILPLLAELYRRVRKRKKHEN